MEFRRVILRSFLNIHLLPPIYKKKIMMKDGGSDSILVYKHVKIVNYLYRKHSHFLMYYFRKGIKIKNLF